MKNPLLFSFGVAALVLQSAPAQTFTNLINSFENSTEGWSIVAGQPWTTTGFSTTTGVTDGSFSWVLTASANPTYASTLASPSSTALTLDLSRASAVKIDVLTPPGSFGFFLQWDLAVNGAATGFSSVDNNAYPAVTIGSETTLTYTIPTSLQTEMAANPNDTTQLIFLIGGGGGGGTMEIDNLRIIDVPEPATLALFGMGALGLMAMARRRA